MGKEGDPTNHILAFLGIIADYKIHQHNKNENCFLALFILLTISAFSQDYIYHTNGNMPDDANKQTTHIHCNIFNLADTIVYGYGRTIIHTYTALQKLSQHVLASSGALLQEQDCIDDFQYRNGTLRLYMSNSFRVRYVK